MGMSDTAGFILHCVIYGSVQVLPMPGYGVHGYGCSVGKSDLWVTCFKPYMVVCCRVQLISLGGIWVDVVTVAHPVYQYSN